MSSFRVEGGHKLSGEIIPQGAKNEALQIISAVLLTDQPVVIHKIPQIRDVLKLIDLLRDLGVEVEDHGEESCTFKAANVNLDFLDTEEFKSLNPTAENIAVVIYNKLRNQLNPKFDLKITLYETERNFVEYPAS